MKLHVWAETFMRGYIAPSTQADWFVAVSASIKPKTSLWVTRLLIRAGRTFCTRLLASAFGLALPNNDSKLLSSSSKCKEIYKDIIHLFTQPSIKLIQQAMWVLCAFTGALDSMAQILIQQQKEPSSTSCHRNADNTVCVTLSLDLLKPAAFAAIQHAASNNTVLLNTVISCIPDPIATLKDLHYFAMRVGHVASQNKNMALVDYLLSCKPSSKEATEAIESWKLAFAIQSTEENSDAVAQIIQSLTLRMMKCVASMQADTGMAWMPELAVYQLEISPKMIALALEGEQYDIADALLDSITADDGTPQCGIIDPCTQAVDDTPRSPTVITSVVSAKTLSSDVSANRAETHLLKNLPLGRSERRQELMFRYCSLPDSQLFLEIFPNCCLSELSNWIETVKVHRIDMITFLISSGFSGCSNIITTAPKAHNAEIDTSFRIREDCIWAAFQAGLVDIAQVLQSAGGDLGWMEAASLDLPSLNSILEDASSLSPPLSPYSNATLQQSIPASALAVFRAYGGKTDTMNARVFTIMATEDEENTTSGTVSIRDLLLNSEEQCIGDHGLDSLSSSLNATSIYSLGSRSLRGSAGSTRSSRDGSAVSKRSPCLLRGLRSAGGAFGASSGSCNAMSATSIPSQVSDDYTWNAYLAGNTEDATPSLSWMEPRSATGRNASLVGLGHSGDSAGMRASFRAAHAAQNHPSWASRENDSASSDMGVTDAYAVYAALGGELNAAPDLILTTKNSPNYNCPAAHSLRTHDSTAAVQPSTVLFAGRRRPSDPPAQSGPALMSGVNTSGRSSHTPKGQQQKDAVSADGPQSSLDSHCDDPSAHVHHKSGLVPNKRGQVSLNHLINFSFPPRQQTFQPMLGGVSSRNGGGSGARRRREYIEPFNKQRFVNANFRFVLRPDGDYQEHLSDPDIIIEWEDIDQVLVASSATNQNGPSCPICLSVPIAPRAAKCSHVFCWPCIRHYLFLGDKLWRKCPICYDSVHAGDLKSIRNSPWKEGNNTSVSGSISPFSRNPSDGKEGSTRATVEFILMKRMAGSTIALPRRSFGDWENHSSPPSITRCIEASSVSSPEEMIQDSPSLTTSRSIDSSDVILFGRIMVSTSDYRMRVAQDDRRMLLKSLDEHRELASRFRHTPGMDSERPFLELCIADIEKFISKGATSRHDPISNGRKQPFMTRRPTTSTVSQSRDHTSSMLDSSLSMTGDIHRSSSTCIPPMYFYQATDGQLVFLHPLDIKILKSAFGEYENFPDRISVPVISSQESTMNTNLRKRCRYLSHLPLSCDVTFCDVELTNVVSQATLELFSGEIGSRNVRLTKQQQQRENLAAAAAAAGMSSSNDYNTTGLYQTTVSGEGDLADSHQDSEWLQQSFGTVTVSDADRSNLGNSHDARSGRSLGLGMQSAGVGTSFAIMAAGASASTRKSVGAQSQSWLPSKSWGESVSSYSHADSPGEESGTDDQQQWMLDLEDNHLLKNGNNGSHGGDSSGHRNNTAAGGSSREKRGKKAILLVSNSGARRR
ncbi:hypothetical protein BSLG_009392 [Batrachochytrium salamandrivorans]|nr:hypothetical protein BSLG_009392 [Batrachochytrium salamandrivorans]